MMITDTEAQQLRQKAQKHLEATVVLLNSLSLAGFEVSAPSIKRVLCAGEPDTYGLEHKIIVKKVI